MRKGTATTIPGLYQLGEPNLWMLRVRGKNHKDNVRQFKGTMGEAHAALEALRAELANPPAAAAMSFETCAPLWLEAVARRKRSSKKAFFETRIKIIARHLMPYWKDHTEFPAKDIVHWKDWLSEQRKVDKYTAGKPYGHGSLKNAWATMKTFMGWWAMETGNPNTMLGMRFDLEAPKRKPKDVLTADELKRFVAALEHQSPDMRALIICCFASGGRFAETSAWHWSDIDWQRGEVRVVRSQVAGEAGKCKTEATRRVVALTPEIMEVLREQQEWLKENGPRADCGDRVFPSTKGEYRSAGTLRKPLKQTLEIAKINKHITAHCCRKTTSNLLRQVATPEQTRSIVGHHRDSEEMTMRYGEFSSDEKRQAAIRAFDGAFSTTKKAS